MKNKDILSHISHRPWELPNTSWSYYQEWNKVLFLHWKVDENVLRRFVPQSLEIDLYKGEAWVSLVAFTMQKIRPRYLPAFPPISDFDEINIRTYVKSEGKSGVYFLSIEGGKLLSCRIAEGLSELPYRYSQIRRSTNSYQSNNKSKQDALQIEFLVGENCEQVSPLEHWLTERYALFQDTKNQDVNLFELHHLPWELQKLKVKELTCEYPRFSDLLIGSPELMHYSKGTQVLAWGKQQIS